jgi:predicted site-specific integrase-resolvase
MKAKEVLKILRIHRVTLSNYVKQNKIKIKQLPNKLYDYDENDVYALLGQTNKRGSVIYARVSTQKQKKDLENQLNALRNFAINSGIQIKQEISDIESGMTIDRKGLNELINQVINYEVDKVIISYKDRLARLNFKTLEELFKNFGTKIIIVNNSENSQTLEQELLNEIISILHTFSMKVYSQRRKKKLVKKDLELENAINL